MLAVIIFVVEVLIALYVHDAIIRPFVGDTLVVILLYAGYRAFIRTTVFRAMLQVVAFAFVVEFLQLMKFVNWIGLKGNKLAEVILGNYFSVWDLVAYAIGGMLIWVIEAKRNER